MLTTPTGLTTPEQYLLQGQWLHEQGQLADAQACYISILQQNPQHATALHLFGISLYQQQRYAEAAYLLQQAQQLSPDDSDLLSDQGLVLMANGDYTSALACFDKAIALVPTMCAAWNNRGVVLQHLQRQTEADDCWLQVLLFKPDHKDALLNLGLSYRQHNQAAAALELFGLLLQHYPTDVIGWREMAKTLVQTGLYHQALHYIEQALLYAPDSNDCLTEQGLILRHLQRYDEALSCFERVAERQPQSADAANNCGVILDDLKRYDAAQIWYQQGLQQEPEHLDARFNLAVSLEKQGKYEQSLHHYQQLTEQHPDHVTAWHGMGGIFLQQRKLGQALRCYRKGLMLSPDNADLWHDCAIVLRDMQRHWLAFSCLWRALQIRPHFASALNTHGMMLYELHQFEDAEDDFQQALALAPDMAEINWNRAHCQLIQGNLLLGWQLYESRFQWPVLQSLQRQWQAPQWQGEPFLAGQTILLYAEQGYGDTIQFCRYVSLVVQRGARVILEVQPALCRLLAQLPGVEQLIARGEPLPAHDWQCSLMSLPRAFATTLNTIPNEQSYLKIATTKRNKAPLAHVTALPQIGFVYAGNPRHHNDRARSIPLPLFQTLLTFPFAEFVCLQHPVTPAMKHSLSELQVRYPDRAIQDFMDTAEIIAELDLVITVDSAVAHLAGALGKEVWILLAYNNDWRWLTDRADSPWYRSARLFRQPMLGDWQSVISEVQKELTHRFSEILM
jgi:Tfp pilus assembly protein PilF